MRTVTRLTGVKINNPLLEKINISQDDLDLANIPGLLMWIEAGSAFFDETTKSIRDRVSGALLLSSGIADSPSLSSFANGAPALDFPSAGVNSYPVDVHANPSAWSFVFAGRPSGLNPPGELLYPAVNILDASYGLRIGFNTEGYFRVYRGNSTVRLTTDTIIVDEDVVLVATFSVENGLSIMKNGVVIASDSSDKIPLDATAFKFGSHTKNMYAGLVGHLMLFDIDLSDQKYSAQLLAVNKILKTKYGIA